MSLSYYVYNDNEDNETSCNHIRLQKALKPFSYLTYVLTVFKPEISAV